MKIYWHLAVITSAVVLNRHATAIIRHEADLGVTVMATFAL